MDMVEDIYKMTKTFPREEKYGLSSQLQRAAISIPSNIAEGAARKNNKEFIQYLYIALGPCSEIETQIEISNRLGYVQDHSLMLENTTGLRRMLQGLIKYIKKK